MSRAWSILRTFAVAGLFIPASPDAAWAQSEDPAARAAARDLGNEGVKAYQQGDYAKAKERLERAYSVVRAPTLALWLGRTLVQQGLLVEASEVLLEATRLSATGGDLAVQTKAQKDAEADRNLLLPRLARLTVMVENVPSGQAQASIDGKPLAAALIGVEHPANPGKRVVSVTADGQTQQQEVTLAEGARESVVFRFDAPEAVAPTPAVPDPAAAAPPAPAEPSSPPPPVEPIRSLASPAPAAPLMDEGSGQTTPWYVYAAWGLGGIGIATGTVAGVLAMKKRDGPALSQACTDDRCAPWASSDVDQYNTLRMVSTVGFVAGVVGVSSAVFVQWILPKIQPGPSRAAFETGPRVSVLVAPGQAGFSVRGWY